MDEEEIATLMPQIYRKLEWLDKEDIIKRVVSLEFNRMIDYYKDADEIQESRRTFGLVSTVQNAANAVPTMQKKVSTLLPELPANQTAYIRTN